MVTAAGAEYVVCLSAKALKLRTGDGARLHRAALCRRAEAEGVQEMPVVIRGDERDAPLSARVIVLAPEQAEAARRRMRNKARKWDDTPSAEALATPAV